MSTFWWILFVLWAVTVGWGLYHHLRPKKPSKSARARPEPAWKVGTRKESKQMGSYLTGSRKLRIVVFVYTKGYDAKHPILTEDAHEVIGDAEPTDRERIENLLIQAEKRQAELSEGFEYAGFLEKSLKREISFE